MLRIILIHFLIDDGRLDFIDTIVDVLAAPSMHLVKLEALLVDHPLVLEDHPFVLLLCLLVEKWLELAKVLVLIRYDLLLDLRCDVGIWVLLHLFEQD